MRNIILLSICLLIFGTYSVQAGTDPDCDSFGRIHKIYYMSCFPRLTGETTDDERIQRAVDSIPSGKLIFNEGLYTVDETVNLRSFLIIEGTSTNNLDNKTSLANSSHIQMTGETAIFKISGAQYDIVIQDLAFSATSQKGTIGILGEGDYPTDPGALNFKFSNLRFSNLQFGIKVQALDEDRVFQFDNVMVEHCAFVGTGTGIYIDSHNSGWQISSLEFFSMGEGQVGIDIVRNSYSEINSVIFAGESSPDPKKPAAPAEASIRVKDHNSLSINNCVSEGVIYDLQVIGPGTSTEAGSTLNYPIYLYNNTFQSKVDISNAVVYATANQYGLEYEFVPQTPLPVARNNSKIYSYGEKFCVEGSSNCFSGGKPVGWIFAPDDPLNPNSVTANMVSSSNEFSNYWSRPSLFNGIIKIETDDYYNPNNDALLTVFAPTALDKPLIRLGVNSSYNYTLSRDGTTGWMTFEGTQAAPYTGYSFDGPVKLPSYTSTTLPTILSNGSMVYCSNCTANTTPCSGSGTGALAVSVNSQWSCK